MMGGLEVLDISVRRRRGHLWCSWRCQSHSSLPRLLLPHENDGRWHKCGPSLLTSTPLTDTAPRQEEHMRRQRGEEQRRQRFTSECRSVPTHSSERVCTCVGNVPCFLVHPWSWCLKNKHQQQFIRKNQKFRILQFKRLWTDDQDHMNHHTVTWCNNLKILWLLPYKRMSSHPPTDQSSTTLRSYRNIYFSEG